MRVIAIVFCFIAAIILAAMPVMACCVTGHGEAGIKSAQASKVMTPPCHDASVSQPNESEAQAPGQHCADCDDCAVSSSHAKLGSHISLPSDLDFVVSAYKSSALPQPEIRLLESTGPPLGLALRPIDSLLFRIDRLLI
ncbi:hypothetical protein [Robiginitomaculum antarcticum]|uniref:hypothetical protein n=1 Tax=Robiginitomaculum antarcticum TaxID=437507 RepID=UPI0012EA882F|nr:hypothetical protein [Robiginitomaculum antarcticum]